MPGLRGIGLVLSCLVSAHSWAADAGGSVARARPVAIALQQLSWEDGDRLRWTCVRQAPAGPERLAFEVDSSAKERSVAPALSKAAMPKGARRSRARPGLELAFEVVASKGFVWSVAPGRDGFLSSTARAFVVSGGSRTLLAEFVVYGARGRLTPYWSPSGARVAVGVEFEESDLDHSDFCLVWGATKGPSIELVVNPFPRDVTRDEVDAASARWDTVRTELRAAGFNVPLVSNAQRHRTRSVLYAPAGTWTAEVERLRALLPGVEVEPLTWASKADVVLALGEEARE